jgi:hypothetical protein
MRSPAFKTSLLTLAVAIGVVAPARAADDFKLIFRENFSRHASRGSMGSASDASKVIYRGAHGTRWVTYPRTFHDTYDRRPYRSDRVLSVHGGKLDFYLHHVDGQPAGANPSPLINGDSQYQTYGRYSARVKVRGRDLSEYHLAFLLWPRNDGEWQSAESDYPEGDLGRGNIELFANAHQGRAGVESFRIPSLNVRRWHTYTQDWTPFVRRYYVDGKLIGQTVNPVFNKPERWQLQVETRGNGNHRGHVYVDWVKVYSL